jgi:acetyltransferase-like isoleucine patch superfamily enzyme
VAEREQAVRVLNAQLAEREQAAQALSEQVSRLSGEITTIHSSRWWKLARLYWTASGRLRAIVGKTNDSIAHHVLPTKATHLGTSQRKQTSSVPEGVAPTLKTLSKGLKFYLANHLISNIPSFRVRHWYYRHVLRYSIGQDSSIHMGTFVTGDFVTIGDNVVVNRNCYLDGRIGLEIGDNVSISPEVYIASMEHDPDSPSFATRGGKVVIESNVWIGARALITPGVTLGEGSVIGAGAVVTKSINPYRIAVGVPARELRDRNRAIHYKCRYSPWFDTDVQRVDQVPVAQGPERAEPNGTLLPSDEAQEE